MRRSNRCCTKLPILSQLLRYLDHFDNLQEITTAEIVVVFNADTTLVPLNNFAYIIFETLQAGDLTRVDLNIVTEDID